MAHTLARTPPLDTVFYALYPDLALNLSSPASIDPPQLSQLRIDCLNAVFPLVHGYIWQHQPFNLLVSTNDRCLCRSQPRHGDESDLEERSSHSPAASSSSSPPQSVAHLHGKVKYGDNIEDEWFVVYILHEISRQVPNLSIRVWDTDGEFLLIEAAYSIPRWLKPENSWNRVFIRQGCLHILPLPSSPSEIYSVPTKPSIIDALQIFSSGTVKTRAADGVQAAIQRRLANYPEKAQQNMHNVWCRVPLPVAQILKHEPQLIALAVEAFYDRDVDSMKAASRMEKFLAKGSESRVEMVDVLVRMSRAMYAQLVQQMFQAPPRYPMPPFSDPHFKEAELGMKITSGFEMMYSERSAFERPLEFDSAAEARTQRELANKDLGWQAFQSSLQEKGYFRGLLEGSKEYRQLLEAAIAQYRQTNFFLQMSTTMHAPIKRINEILLLTHSTDDFMDTHMLQSDDDSWLYNGEEDLKNAMLERQKEMDGYEAKQARCKVSKSPAKCETSLVERGEKMERFNPEDIANNVQAFVKKISSFEGAELPETSENDNGDDSVSINMGRFLKELQSAIGSKVEASHFEHENEWLEDMETSSSEIDFDDDESENRQRDEDMIAEFYHSSDLRGVEKNEKNNNEWNENNEKGNNLFMEEYSEALEQELFHSSLAKSFTRAENSSAAADTKDVVMDEEGLPPVNIDVNLVQSLLESFSSQHGLPGPTSNLLGAMGLHLPNDFKDK